MSNMLVVRINDPMTSQHTILIGKITKTFGFEGGLTVKLEKEFSEDIPEMKSVFLEIEGRPVPFFIEYIEHGSPGYIRMKFEDYDSVSEVEEFTGCPVLANLNRLKANNDNFQIESLKGFNVLSGNHVVGIISGIVTNPGQYLLEVVSETGKIILIPLHEDLIEKISYDQRSVFMFLPEGLIEVN